MFPALKADITERFERIEAFFGATKAFAGDDEMTAKGLVFVQTYAAYEYTVCKAVEAAIDGVNSHRHRLKDLSPSLLALFLDADLSSLRDVSGKSVWEKRVALFERVFSSDTADISAANYMPHDGSHFRYTQLQMIFRVFGISRMPVRRRRHLFRINEVVNHRNQIAHGSDTAENIGRRYSRSEILHITKQMKSVCLLQVDIFENYCMKKAKHRR
jgi:hypothetical protein